LAASRRIGRLVSQEYTSEGLPIDKLALLIANWHVIMPKGGFMKTTIDRFGRLVLPKQIRDRIGLKPGSEIVIEELEGEIVIRHSEQKTPLQYEDGILVFAGAAVGDLTESIRKHREERLSKFAIGKIR
jgi:AbrB family looped-hinge helix DNA binding protein